MADPGLRLIGYRYSVYCRVVRMALHELGLAATWQEVDPFDAPDHGDLSPFGRVPVLLHGEFRVYETSAILLYLNSLSDVSLVPSNPAALARMQQVIGIVDAYGYRCLVRQVFSHAVFRPAFDEAANRSEIAAGLSAAGPVLAAIEDIAREGFQLCETLSLADIHLAPMLACFAMAPQGRELLGNYPALSVWLASMARRDSFRATELPAPF